MHHALCVLFVTSQLYSLAFSLTTNSHRIMYLCVHQCVCVCVCVCVHAKIQVRYICSCLPVMLAVRSSHHKPKTQKYNPKDLFCQQDSFYQIRHLSILYSQTIIQHSQQTPYSHYEWEVHKTQLNSNQHHHIINLKLITETLTPQQRTSSWKYYADISLNCTESPNLKHIPWITNP